MWLNAWINIQVETTMCWNVHNKVVMWLQISHYVCLMTFLVVSPAVNILKALLWDDGRWAGHASVIDCCTISNTYTALCIRQTQTLCIRRTLCRPWYTNGHFCCFDSLLTVLTIGTCWHSLGRHVTIGTPMVIFAVLTVFQLFLLSFDWFFCFWRSSKTVKKQSKESKQQKMTIGVLTHSLLRLTSWGS